MRRSGTCVMLVLFQAITSPLHSLERLHAIAPVSQRAMGASSILKSSGLASCIQDLKFAINYSSTTDTRLTVEDEVQYLLHLRGATVCKIQDKEEAADSRFISLAPHVSLSLSLSLSLQPPTSLSLSLLPPTSLSLSPLSPLSTYRYAKIYVPYKQLYHRLITTRRFQGQGESERDRQRQRQTE